jgi:acyl carrier protein
MTISDIGMDDIRTVVTGLWSEALALVSPEPDVSFLDAGGHSLIAAQLVELLREELDVDLGISVLFRSPTLGDLIEVVAYLSSGSQGAPPAWLVAAGVTP